jgi:hypothetical protein
VQIHHPRRTTQRTNGTAPSVACFIPPLYPILAILDQRPADRQNLQRNRIRLRRGNRLERM